MVSSPAGPRRGVGSIVDDDTPALSFASSTSDTASGTAACTNAAGCAVKLFIAQQDASGPEGRTLIGRTTVGLGTDVPFNIPVVGLNAGDRVTATLTDTGGTSSFSATVIAS